MIVPLRQARAIPAGNPVPVRRKTSLGNGLAALWAFLADRAGP